MNSAAHTNGAETMDKELRKMLDELRADPGHQRRQADKARAQTLARRESALVDWSIGQEYPALCMRTLEQDNATTDREIGESLGRLKMGVFSARLA